MQRVTFFVRGRVQGVGFRWWARATALELGLTGYAQNLADGRVEILAQGQRSDLQRLEELLREEPATTGRPGRVESVAAQPGDVRGGLSGFTER